MTTSGTRTFTVTARDILTDTMYLLNDLAIGEVPSNSQLEVYKRTLNNMFKAMSYDGSPFFKGLKAYSRTEITIPLVDSAEYVLYPNYTGSETNYIDSEVPVKVYRASLLDINDYETSVLRMIPMEYYKITNKTTVGTPTACYYQRELTVGRLYLNLVPDTTTTDTLKLYALLETQDVDAYSETLEFPKEMALPIMYNLAILMSPVLGKAVSQDLYILAEKWMQNAQAFFPEKTVDYFECGRD